MSTSRHGRGIFRTVFKNFVDSFKHLGKKTAFDEGSGTLIGKDPFGNRYYELPADPSRGKRRPQRWYISPDTYQKEALGRDSAGGFDAKMPSEWESWLRHRREQPPSEETVLQNMAIADMKKRNAARLEVKRIEELEAQGRYTGPPQPQDHEKDPYPKYAEFESNPGDDAELKRRQRAEYENPYLEEELRKSQQKKAGAKEEDSKK